MAIYMWREYISPRRWPCEIGFHVPLYSEMVDMYNAWRSLWGGQYDWNQLKGILKRPYAWGRSHSNSNIEQFNTAGICWASDSRNSNSAYRMIINSNVINPDYDVKSSAYSVRWFKDEAAIPTSSWTKLYWTSIEAGWIFWSSTDWLISISSDWVTWITISDKNVWATQVWNSWDTLTDDNCGYLFQWGNNYGFPHSWTVTTSSTQVDASNYWPWNYYSSSTFITRSSSPYNWDSSNNTNLRWWDES